MAALACGRCGLDLPGGRRAGRMGLADLPAAPYEILAGSLLGTTASTAALLVRRQDGWLWSLDAAVALGTTRAAIGLLRISSDGYAVSLVTLTVASSLAFVSWRRLRLPVALWSAAFLGGLALLCSVCVGTHSVSDLGG